MSVTDPQPLSRQKTSAENQEEGSVVKSDTQISERRHPSDEFIDSIPIGIYRTTRDGRILLANPALVHMLGYRSFDELATRNLEHEGFEPGYPRKEFIDRVEREGSVQGLCSIWKRADGQWLYVSENARVVRDENGDTLYYEGTVEDISGKKWLSHPAASEIIGTVTSPTAESPEQHPIHVRTLALFENATDPAYSISRNGKIQWANAAWEVFTGCSRNESTGDEFDIFLHPDDREVARNDFRLALAGQLPPPRQTRYCHRNGEIRTSHRIMLPRFDSSHSVVEVLVMDHDITMSQKKQRELEESEEKYAKLFRHSNDMIFLYDQTGNIIDANQRSLETLGYSLEELLTLNVTDLHPESEHSRCQEMFSLTDETGKVSFEILFRTKSGQEILAEVSSSRFEARETSLIQGVARDISKWRKAQRELLLAKQEWENIFQIMGQPALIIDPEKRIRRANRAAIQTFRQTEEDLVGSFCYEKLPCQYSGGSDCPHSRTLKTGLCVTDRVDWDSTDECFIVSTSPIFDEKENIVAIVHVSTDITEQRNEAAKQQQLTIEMQQAQKLESLGLMAGGIAHDFNNLLVGVLGNADLALLEVDRQSRIRPHLERILSGSNRLSELTNQILAFSGRGTFILKPVDISEAVKKITPLALTSASKKIAFHSTLLSNPPSIEADISQIQQVIMNILTNAFEAIGDAQGTVSITTGIEKRTTSERTETGDLCSTHSVYFRVTDTGCGISEENRRKIFDPFFSTKFTGRGLGLATVLGIVRAHQGDIEVETTPGEGSTFTVYFPISSEIEQSALEGRASEKFQGLGTVLVVDDEEVVREVATNMLSVSGFRVITAADGIEALEIIHQEENIDAVILDLTMPKLDGIETYAKLSEVRPELPVILSSGYSEQSAVAKFKQKGLSGFIQKPYRIQTLVDKLKSVLE